jgi:hypothetical protein
MRNVLFRKSLVIGVILLFVGASVIPVISGNVGISESIKIENEKSSIDFSSPFLFFTENAGQFHKDVLYQVRTSAVTIFLCHDELVSVFSRPGEKESEVEIQSIVTKIIGANNDVIIQGEGVLPHHNNYYIGNDPDKWYIDVPNYKAVNYKNIYPGIDLKFYIFENSLKYDFIVSPEANPSDIKILYEGIDNLFITSEGDIKIDTKFSSIIEEKPYIYQVLNGVQNQIEGQYEIIDSSSFGFQIDENYNPSLPLVIDPTLKYSTYLGGNNDDVGEEISADSSGNVYVVGHTDSTNFPTQNPYQGNLSALTDAFITKLHTSTNTLVYSTYLGGSNFDYGTGIDIDSTGFASIVGTTYSNNLPVFAALFPNLNGIQDAFVARLNPSGAIVFCTYLGGANWEWGLNIAADSSGHSYVVGYTDSSDFPISNAYDSTWNGGFDIFVSKFDPPGGVLLFSTYLGGSNHDIGMGIDFDVGGKALIVGYTWSTNFPVTGNAYDSSYNGGADICLATLDTVTGGPGSLSYGSYIFGTADDIPYDIANNGTNVFYVTGETASTQANFFPITSNAYQQFLQGARDAFFFQLDSSLAPANQMLYCTYLGGQTGGSGSDSARSIELDSSNNAYIAGLTECSDFPLVNPLGSYNGGNEAFASLFDPTQSGTASLLDSTYIGGSGHDEGFGIAIDNNDDAFVTGLTSSTDFPTLNPYQNSNAGQSDAFITHIGVPGNNPPQQPMTPSGPINGKVGVSYPYTTSATDPDGDIMRFGWDWNGNGVVDQWDDNGGSWYNSGQLCTTSHSWSTQGTYQIKVMAEDTHGAASVWSNPLTVTMPKNKALDSTFILRLFEQFPNAFPILRHILGF